MPLASPSKLLRAKRSYLRPLEEEDSRFGGPPRRELANLVVDGEDRQVHREHDDSDHAADEDDHQRLQQRGEGLDLGVDLGLVEVGDLGQHLLELAGLLTDVDHVPDHRREHAVLLDRMVDGAASPNRLVDVIHRELDLRVARGLPGDLDRLEDRHAGAHGAGEGPGPSRERRLLDHVADVERDLDLQGIPLWAAPLGLLPLEEADDQADKPRDPEEPEAGDGIREADRYLGDEWKIC